MRTNTRFLMLASSAVAVGLVSSQALATSQTGTAKAHIMQAITVTETTNMNFANIFPNGAGTAVLTPAGAISGTAGYIFQGTPAAGAFSVSGDPNAAIVISTGGAATLNGPSSATMTLDTFTLSAASGTLDGSGNGSFTVGGTLHVGAAQTAGDYSGSYTVTVNY